MRKNRRGVMLARAVLVAAVALPLAACFWERGEQPLQGYIEGTYVSVSPEDAGRIDVRPVDRGAHVAKGALLFRLSSAEQQAAVAQAQARVAQAESQVAQAQSSFDAAGKDFARINDLRKSNVVSQAGFDNAKAQRDVADGELSAAQRNLAALQAAQEMAQVQLDRRTVVAPADGTIEDTYFEPGEFVGVAQPVISLLPDNGRKIRFYVPETRLNEIKLGDTVAVSCDGCASGLNGEITFHRHAGRIHATSDLLNRQPGEARLSRRGAPARRSRFARGRTACRSGHGGQMNDEKVIAVEGLTKKFGDRTVVDHISLDVRRGEIVGFLGPNGSGKTTTIRMLCGLLKPDAGSGTCLGYDIVTHSDLIKLEVGYMTQRFSLYEDLTIRENLEFVARLYGLAPLKQYVDETLTRLGLTDRQKQLAGTLSGGWKQRLALAACIMHRPQLLLLDEPTAGVDPKARREFWDEIHSLAAEGLTVLVSTHYMDEAERCHRVIYISYGTIVARGTVPEVIAQSGLATLMVRGATPEMVRRFRAHAGVEEVASFGSDIHVLGFDRAKLRQAVDEVVAGTSATVDGIRHGA